MKIKDGMSVEWLGLSFLERPFLRNTVVLIEHLFNRFFSRTSVKQGTGSKVLRE